MLLHQPVALVRVLRLQQGRIDLAPALLSLRPVAHAVVGGKAVGQGGVHAGDDRRDGRIGQVAVHGALQPGDLLRVELVAAGVVESEEVDAVLDPVVVRSDAMILRVVLQPLALNRRGIDPIGELRDVLGARLG